MIESATEDIYDTLGTGSATDEHLMIETERLSQAHRMLSEARSVADYRDLRDYSTSLRAWARARGLGIESENQAAEFILRAERGVGQELTRMRVAGERSGRGWPKGVPHDEHGRIPAGPGLWEKAVRLSDLGISPQDSSYWQALAAMQDDAFEAAIADALKPGPDGQVRRLSKAVLYRLSRRGPSHHDAPVKNDPVAPFEELRVHIAGFLAGGIDRLSPDDVVGVGKLGVRLVKAARAEMDRRGLR